MGRLHVKTKEITGGMWNAAHQRGKSVMTKGGSGKWERIWECVVRLKNRPLKEGMLVDNPLLEQDKESFAGKVKQRWLLNNKDCFVIINPWIYTERPKVQGDHDMK
jgi:hypothetical protein